MTPQHQSALEYADLNYDVLPCEPNQKRPKLSNGLLGATADVEQVDSWWTAAPNANVAIRTDGLLVLDLDTNKDGNPNAWLADDPEKLQSLAAAPLSITPRGGRHYFFRQPAGIGFRNTAGKLAPGVDTRADGGYVLVPPSIVNGNSYRWASDIRLDCTLDKLPLPPDWLLKLLNPSDRCPSVRADNPTGNDIPSGQRNATLTSLAGSMRRVGMGTKEVLAALLATNIERCKPPMEQEEVERIARSSERFEPDGITVSVVEHHAAQDGAKASSDPGPLPSELLDVPGFVNAMKSHILETAPYPDPVLALLPSLALQSLLCSRKVRDSAENRPTIYLLGTANSGAGKDHGRKVIQRLLVEVGQPDFLGDSIASAEGLEDAISATSAFLAIIDEMGGLLNAIKSGREPRYEAIMNALLKLYSSVNGIYPMRLKAGQHGRYIDQPALVLYGTATPGEVYGSITPRMLTNGLFSRLLIADAGKRGKGQEPVARDLPIEVIEAAKYWIGFTPGEQRANLSQWHPAPKAIDITPEASNVFRDFREAMDDEYAKAEAGGDEPSMALLARAHEKARRLALIYAASANHENPLIDDNAAVWSTRFVEHLTRRMLFAASSLVSENEFDAKCNRMLASLRTWKEANGDAFMPYWRVGRKFRAWRKNEIEELTQALAARGEIEIRAMPSPGYRIR